MKKVVLVVALLGLVLVTPTFAAAGKSSKADFEQKKAARISKLDERIALLQGERACLNGVTTPEAFKSCQTKYKGERKAVRKENKK